MFPVRSALAVLEHFLVDHGEAIARLDVEHEVDVVLKDLGEFEGDAVVESSASAAAWNSELSMVALAVRVWISSGFSSTSLLKPLRVARDLQRLAVRQLAFESHQFAVAMHEAQQFAGLEAVELAAQLGQTAQASRDRRGSARSGGTAGPSCRCG